MINSAGEVAGDSFLSNGLVNATSWSSKKIKNLGALPKAIFTAGLAINDNGYIVGESVFGYGPPFTSHGFRWERFHHEGSRHTAGRRYQYGECHQ